MNKLSSGIKYLPVMKWEIKKNKQADRDSLLHQGVYLVEKEIKCILLGLIF